MLIIVQNGANYSDKHYYLLHKTGLIRCIIAVFLGLFMVETTSIIGINGANYYAKQP
jgi:hypothetical protein